MLTTGETWKGADGANMRDLSFSVINVEVFHLWEHTLDSINSVNSDGDLIHTVTLRVDKGAFADKYTDIGVQLVSEWNSPRAGGGVDVSRPNLVYCDLGDIKWQRECPPVQ